MEKLKCQWGNVYLEKGRGGWFPPAGEYEDARVVDFSLHEYRGRIAELVAAKSAFAPRADEMSGVFRATVQEILQDLHPENAPIYEDGANRVRRLVVNLVDYDALERAGVLEINGPLERGLHTMIGSRSLDYQFFWAGTPSRMRRNFMTAHDWALEFLRNYNVAGFGDWKAPATPAHRRP